MKLCNRSLNSELRHLAILTLLCIVPSANAQALNGIFDNPRAVRGMNSRYRDTEPFVTADGLSIFFTSDRFSEAAPVDWTLANIWEATRTSTSDEFGEPVRIEFPWNVDNVGIINPTLSENNKVMHFFTGSGPGNGDGQIYVTKRKSNSDPWSEPQLLGENINRPGFDNLVGHVTEDGLTIWFSSAVDGDSNYSIFQASRSTADEPFGNATPLEKINTEEYFEIGATVSSDGLLLVYESNRDGFGFSELWISTRPSTDDEFDDPMRINDAGIGELNTNDAAEFSPFLSQDWPADGSKLYYGRAISETDWDLYEATWISNARAGDFDGNGIIDAADVDFLTSAIRRNASAVGFDLDTSGIVNEGDLTAMVETVLGTWVGDSNLDGEFNSGDLVAVFQAGRYETGNVATWSQGDWNADGVFNSGDFVTGFQGGGYEQGPRGEVRAVPEPTGMLGLIAALTGVAIYRRR